MQQELLYNNDSTFLLSSEHLAQLRASAISDDIIRERGYRTVQGYDDYRPLASEGVGMGPRQFKPGLAFPIYRVGAEQPYTWVIRPDNPRGKEGKTIKYEWPKGKPTVFDVLPRFAEALRDPTIPIWITEGAKKADSIASNMPGVVPIDINGVWGWVTKDPKTGAKLISDCVREVALEGRKAILAFDSDVSRKPEVQRAMQEMAKSLLLRRANVFALYLPDGEDKLGIDDAFAQGWTPAQIEALLAPFDGGIKVGGTLLHNNLGLGGAIRLPDSYMYPPGGGKLLRQTARGEWQPFYNGDLTLVSTGVDMANGQEMLTVAFKGTGNISKMVTAPRAELSRSNGVIENLGAAGAAVYENNAKYVSEYLIELASANKDALPHHRHTSKLGLVDDGLVLPCSSVGFPYEVKYEGREICCGKDTATYRDVITEALTWTDAHLHWLLFGASLAGPVIARMKTRRNPVFYVAGGSGFGKTTSAMFALGVWGDPTRAPFMAQGNDTTPVAISQTIASLRGLPMLVDEAHLVDEKRERLENLAYRFANGQSRLIGSIDQKTRGGDSIGGALFLVGEARPDFKHAGSNNRVMWVNAEKHPPLGAKQQSELGAQRAHLLERAWRESAGTVGPLVAKHIWERWDTFVDDVRESESILRQSRPELTQLDAWVQPLVIVFQTLNWAFEALDIAIPQGFFDELVSNVVAMLVADREQVNPANDAWNNLMTMLAVSDANYEDGWDIRRLNGENIAYRKQGEADWRVLTDTKAFKERVTSTALQSFGRAWVEKELVIPDAHGNTTAQRRIAEPGKPRTLLVPDKVLTGDDE